MITISTKDFRQNLQLILDKIATGEDILWIHRSSPVAEIRKPRNFQSFQEATAKDIENSAVQDLSQDFLSQEELNYYLSLQ